MPLTPLKDLLTTKIIQSRDVDAILTPDVWSDLEAGYQHYFAELLARDGKNPNIPGGGDNIKDNPQLQQAIHDMFTGFVRLSVEKYIIAHSGPQPDMGRHKAIDEIEQRETDFSKNWIRRLTQPHYGYPPTPGDKQEEPAPALNPKDAQRIAGTVIKDTLTVCCACASSSYLISRKSVFLMRWGKVREPRAG